MRIKQKTIDSKGIKFSIIDEGKEIGRAYLYIMKNNLHKRPFGFLEDVFVDENVRGQGIGTRLIKRVLAEAIKNKCYKIITASRHSRPKVHKLYEKLGFKNHGVEFRIDL